MKTHIDQTLAVPLNPVLLLPTYEPVNQCSLLAAIPLDEERVLRWLRWCDHWGMVARAEPSARSLTFEDDTVQVFDTSMWRGDGEGTETADVDEPVIADSRGLDTDAADSRIVYDAEIEIGCDHIRWGLELKGASYRIATAEVSRAQLLGFLCRICSDADLPRRFAELMSASAGMALDLIKHGARLRGEPKGSGRHLGHTLSTHDLLPALESDDPELRMRAMALLGQLRGNRKLASRR